MQQVISFEDAKALGLKHYYTGVPCRHGHIGPRMTHGKYCIQCHKDCVRSFFDRVRPLRKATERVRVLGNHASRARALLRRARTRSEKYGIAFEVELTDILIPDRCPCCDIQMQWKGTVASSGAVASLDRINSQLGYIKGNVAVICTRCNRLKSDATAKELRQIAAWLDRGNN